MQLAVTPQFIDRILFSLRRNLALTGLVGLITPMLLELSLKLAGSLELDIKQKQHRCGNADEFLLYNESPRAQISSSSKTSYVSILPSLIIHLVLIACIEILSA